MGGSFAAFITWAEGITGDISTYMYTYFLTFLLIFAGLYFTVRTKAVQLTMIKDMFRAITEQKHVEGESAVSSFQALMISTASRVGTGNIAGIAVAIAVGGPGAIFWMWLMAIIGSASAFVESTLAQIFKVHADDGLFRGGPAYYIEQALNKRWLAILFSISLILCFGYGFNALQAYNMSDALSYYIPNYQQSMAPVALGMVIVVATAFIIFGGSKRIASVSSLIVPVMAISYIILSLVITVLNITEVPRALAFIFSNAFDFSSIVGGFSGSVIVIGIKRGLFSNEAGMGSAPNAAASASVSHPVKQGLVQSLSVYIDTLLVCTCSAMIIMMFYVTGQADGLKGMALVQASVEWAIGKGGIHFITFVIYTFAFSSIIGNYFYAESNIRFINPSNTLLVIFRLTVLAAVFFGCLASFDLAWNIADIVMGIMALINVLCVLPLSRYVLIALKDYRRQRSEGKDPVFVADHIEGFPKTECWHIESLQQAGRPIPDYFQQALGFDKKECDSYKRAHR